MENETEERTREKIFMTGNNKEGYSFYLARVPSPSKTDQQLLQESVYVARVYSTKVKKHFCVMGIRFHGTCSQDVVEILGIEHNEQNLESKFYDYAQDFGHSLCYGIRDFVTPTELKEGK